MKKTIVLYTASVLMFCFGIYLTQYQCGWDSTDTVLNGTNVCRFDFNTYVMPLIYPAIFIFLSILIAVVTLIKQNDL